MTATVPTTEPASLVAGDTWAWTRALADWPASDDWTLTYYFHKSGTKFSIEASASGADHAVSVAKATTADFTAGRYTWDAYVDNGTERHRVDSGILDVLPDLAGATALDRRSHAVKTLEAIEAVIEDRATKDQQNYAINGRSLSRTPLADLLMLRARYKAEVAREKAAERIANGQASGRMVLTRVKGAG